MFLSFDDAFSHNFFTGTTQRPLQRSAGRGSAIRFGAGSTVLIVAEVALAVGVLSSGAAWARTVLHDRTGEMGIELGRYLAAQLRIPSVEPMVDQADTHLEDFWTRVWVGGRTSRRTPRISGLDDPPTRRASSHSEGRP